MNPTKPARPAVVIGLLGGIASGKSWVAGALGEHGFRTIDADAEAREVCADPKILAAIGARFGSELVEAGLNRPALANLVFQPSQSVDHQGWVHGAQDRLQLAR